MPKLGEAFVVIRAALGPLKSGLAAAKTAVTKAMSLMTNAVKKAMSISYKWIKRAMVAIAGAVLASVYAFSKFEQQMANVSTMLDDHTMHYMPRYSKAIKKMSIAFGEGTESLSKGLYDILSASIAPAKALEVLAVSAKAAKAGLTTTAVAADAITTILNSYGMEAEKAGQISDVLFAIVKRGKLTFYELAQSVGKVAATAAIAGLSFEEVGAAIATMTRAGLNAFLSTTALRSILSQFLKPAEGAIKAARELGFELNTTTLKTIGLVGVLGKLKNATAEQIAQIMPNRRALAGFAASVKNVEGQAFDLNLMLNSVGLTQIAYEKNTKTLRHSLNRLKQVFIVLANTLGSTVAMGFDLLTDATIEGTKKVVDYLEKHKFAIMEWSVVVASRINFVRGIIQDFVKGAYQNWPETWKYMKDMAVGQLDIIWQSFNLNIASALKVATKLFVAFGKSLYFVFKKAFMDIGASIGTWLANASILRDIRKQTAKLLMEDKGYKYIGDYVAGREGGKYTKPQYDKDIKAAMKEAGELVNKGMNQGWYEDKLEKPQLIGSWGEVGKDIERVLTPALKDAKEEVVRIGKELIKMEKKLLKTPKPGYLTPSITRWMEMIRLQEKYLDRIDEMEKAAAAVSGGAGVPGGAGGDGGSAGAGGARVGFVGFKEAWNQLAMSLSPGEDKLLKEAKVTNKELSMVNEHLEGLAPGMKS